MLINRKRLFALLSRRATYPVRRAWYRTRSRATRDYRFLFFWIALLLLAVVVQPLVGHFQPGCRAASSLVPDF